MRSRCLALAGACWLGLVAGAAAQTPQGGGSAPPPAAATNAIPAATPTRIRGSIVAVTPDRLTIKTREGTTVPVSLVQPVTVTTVKRVALADIRDGTYVGIASREDQHGTPVALEVLVFPEKMRGVGAGHYAWDLQPHSMMTNAPVTGVLKGKSGRDLTLTHAGGNITIHVPPQVPVVTLVPASTADLKQGRKVFLIARSVDGHLSTSRVTVQTHGVAPPM